MGSSEVIKAIDQTLNDLRKRLDNYQFDDSVGDVDITFSDGKLTVEFEDRTTFIINRQSAVDQIWLAEPNGGWHFNYVDGRWICTKRGVELISSVEDLLSAKVGTKIEL